MSWAGFDATGLELSPWVAELAQDISLPMLVGPIEQQNLAPASFDVIVANDVMEHLPDPLATLAATAELLRPNGVLIIQMPEFVEGKTLAERVAANERFLEHTKVPTEHLYLYSRRSAALLMRRLSLNHVEFSDAIFDYDMYFVASRQPPPRHDQSAIAANLQATPQGRMVLALLDKHTATERLTRLWQESEADRNARFQLISKLSDDLNTVQENLDNRTRTSEQQVNIIRTQHLHTETLQFALAFLQIASLDSDQGTWPALSRMVVKYMLPEWIKRRVCKPEIAGPAPAGSKVPMTGIAHDPVVANAVAHDTHGPCPAAWRRGAAAHCRRRFDSLAAAGFARSRCRCSASLAAGHVRVAAQLALDPAYLANQSRLLCPIGRVPGGAIACSQPIRMVGCQLVRGRGA